MPRSWLFAITAALSVKILPSKRQQPRRFHKGDHGTPQYFQPAPLREERENCVSHQKHMDPE
jgi:hypothetical protein